MVNPLLRKLFGSMVERRINRLVEGEDVATKPPVGNIVVENIVIGVEQQTEKSNEPLDTRKVETTGVLTDASTEPPATTETQKPTKSPAVDSTEVNKEKLVVDTTIKSSEAQTETPSGEDTKKLVEQQLHTEKNIEKQVEQHAPSQTMPSATSDKPKPLVVEMKTQTDPPEKEESKAITTTDKLQIVKIVGQTLRTSMFEFRPTSVTEVLLD
ncbi:uncharacterized protein LOC131858396 [Cryptomeria japonica]|uniref:uncharacterized protein LOC131858396 n=1 Tax=Cryptomeria japonica TaxID=3369 RepID=UPI0027DA75C8|nr:uncharacterized protein LOC131858396 [Cryptomeria japonica]